MTLSSGSQVASVDGLRGLLAALVMVEHFPYLQAQTIFAVPSRLAVMIFFVMSGYVLTRAWDGNLPIFLVRRFVRLWPLYALTLFIGGVSIRHAPPWTYYLWWPLLGDADYVHANPAAWSLFIEAWAMPLMPLIVWSGRSTIRAALAVSVFIAAARFNLNVIYFTMFIAGSYFAASSFRVDFLERALRSGSAKSLTRSISLIASPTAPSTTSSPRRSRRCCSSPPALRQRRSLGFWSRTRASRRRGGSQRL